MTMIKQALTVGERMVRARLWVGLDQSEMAQALGKTARTVGAWERGENEPPFSAVAQWARITGRTLDWIAYGDQNDEGPAFAGPRSVRPEGFEPPTV